MDVESSEKRRPAYAGAVIAFGLLWTGLLLGVSFLATPAKFSAPSLTLPVALDVGRQTFAVFNPVELALAIAMAGFAVIGRSRLTIRLLALLLVALVGLQSMWLLPSLDARVSLILEQKPLPPSRLHEIYIAVDITKLLLLASVVWLQSRGVTDGKVSRNLRQPRMKGSKREY